MKSILPYPDFEFSYSKISFKIFIMGYFLVVFFLILDVNGVYLHRIVRVGDVTYFVPFVDTDGDVHIVVSTQSSITSFNENGDKEWSIPGLSYIETRKTTCRSDYIIGYKLISPGRVKLFSIDVKRGKIKDSISVKTKGLFPGIEGLRLNYYIIVIRKNTSVDTPNIGFFRISSNGKFSKIRYLHAGFGFERSAYWKDDIYLIGMWAPKNLEAPSEGGISDLHVGLAMISLLSSHIINRFMVPYNDFSRSIVLPPKNDSTVFLVYRANFRNFEPYSGIYLLKLPELKPIVHVEKEGNFETSDRLVNGRYIAMYNMSSDSLYIFDTEKNLEVVRGINIEKYTFQKNFYANFPNTRYRISSYVVIDDIDSNGSDEIILIIRKNVENLDPRWARIYSRNGSVDADEFIVIVGGKDFNKIFPVYLGNGVAAAIKEIHGKKMFVGITEGRESIVIYRVY